MTTPVLVRTRAELTAARRELPGRVAVVMTMGALHEGHAELIRVAHRHAGAVVVTVFVNPLQFGAGEDLDRYPRTLDADVEVCAREQVDVVFAPSVGEVYPPGESVEEVRAGELGDRLEGAFRPGHFDGVLTVVSRLLDLTEPDVAVYGEKDAQQLALIRRMAHQRQSPVQVIGVPTVREPGGLALSSRNRYLSADDREVAQAIPRALLAVAQHAADGSQAALAAARAVLDQQAGIETDYLEMVDARSWEPPGPETVDALVLIAARVGSTRLIDNRHVILGSDASAPNSVG